MAMCPYRFEEEDGSFTRCSGEPGHEEPHTFDGPHGAAVIDAAFVYVEPAPPAPPA